MSEVVEIAKTYYDSTDADTFYFTIWGGEDIHIGLYEDGDTVYDASRKTVQKMIETLPEINENTRVLDIGSGFGGAARYIAKTTGAHVTALNLSTVENERNRKMNREQGLDEKIDVVDGSFEELPFADDSFNVVWSQDAILHSGNREKVIEEVARVLKEGGSFVFTDPMMTDDCPLDTLQPVLDRIHLATLGSPGFYRSAAQKNGLREAAFIDLSPQLPVHYSRIHQETEKKEEELQKLVSSEYITNMKKGLQHWVDAGYAGRLAWGIFRFDK
ncbi:MAG: SAM-dependent methyltransferase [Spirochaetota bacterium]